MSNNTTMHSIPPPFSESFGIFMLLMYGIVLVFGFIGNGFTCVAVLTVRTMRRSVHFYTFNLAVADLLMMFLYVPTQMKFILQKLDWTMGQVLCSVAYCVIPLCLSASIGTLIAISIDRYIGLTRPFDWRASSSRNAKIIIPLIWVLSAATAFPVAYFAKVDLGYGNIHYCYENWPNPRAKYEMCYWTFIMIVQYIIPLFFITGVHIHMAYIVGVNERAENELHKRMMRMVVLLLLTYSICNGMQHINFYLAVYRKIQGDYLFVVSNFLISLQAAVNPFIFGVTRNDYKNIFNKLMKNYLIKFASVLGKKRFVSTNDESVTLTPGKKNYSQLYSRDKIYADLEPLSVNIPVQKQRSNTADSENYYEHKILKNDSEKQTLSKTPLTMQYLQVPKRKVRKETLRFDTLCYLPDDVYENYLKRTARVKKNIKSSNEPIIMNSYQNIANSNQGNVKTANRFDASIHPIIIITEPSTNQSQSVTRNLSEDWMNMFLSADFDFSHFHRLLDRAPESVI